MLILEVFPVKKIISPFLVLSLSLSLLAACGQKNTAAEPNVPASQDDGKLRIVTTIFPEYDWVREILGDRVKGHPSDGCTQ